MFKKYPITSRLLVIIILPLCAGAIYLYSQLNSSLTPVEGTLEVKGLAQSVTISHDAYGTPTIVAETDLDAYFALGFKHASDRMWQLEVQRRLAQGSLSELFGAQLLSSDITMRTLGIYKAASESLPFLDGETVEALTAYANGINAWIEQSTELPIEFKLFDIRPDPWKVVDSIAWQKTFSLTLSGNMTDELRRSELQKHLTPEQIRYIYPYDPVPEYTVAPQVVDPILVDLVELTEFGIGRPFTGSNAWVVAGRHTQSGYPIIANDPHLGLQVPSSWYAASMKGDKLDVSGMTLVGLPMVIFGRNNIIAWGGTNLQSDQQDLFVETTSPQQPNRYLDGDRWKQFETRKEVIQVSADFPAFLREETAPVTIVVRQTVRGPIVSDMQGAAEAVVSLRWSALDAEDRTVDAFYHLQYAQGWEDFRLALSQLKTPGLNLLYADKEGNIGHQVAGMIPKRAQGVGILPIRASSDNSWLGYHDFDSLPSTYNPPKGYIVNANERIEHPPQMSISHEWAPQARHQRITRILENLIEEKADITVDDMREIQSDSKDLTALVLLPFMQRVQGETTQERNAISVIKSWDGRFHPDSVGATIFSFWSHYLKQKIFSSAFDHNWQRPEQTSMLTASLERMSWADLAAVVETNDHGWCSTSQSNACANELETSLDTALEQLTKISGTESVEEWTWKELSTTEFVHQPLGRVKGLKWLFRRNINSVTSPNSVNASNHQFDENAGFTQNFGASFRQVIGLDEWENHWYMVSTGQSGNVMSEHFDDMVLPFSRAEIVPLDTEHDADTRLKLVPSVGH